jgi:capsular polysaccharide biosynthesis protein
MVIWLDGDMVFSHWVIVLGHWVIKLLVIRSLRWVIRSLNYWSLGHFQIFEFKNDTLAH